MTYAAYLDSVMTCWPSLHLDEFDVLHQTFFVLGNGLWWVDGELTDGHTHEERYASALALDRRYSEFPGIESPEQARAEVRFERLHSDHYWPMPDGGFGEPLYPQCSLCKIAQLPDDIKPDWLDAAKRALAWARSDRCLFAESDRPFLEAAEDRVRKLEARHP